MRQLLLTVTVILGLATGVEAQWQVPARQTSANTNDFGWVPTSKTNVQLVIDWLDDNLGATYTNTYAMLPSGTYNILQLWPFMSNVDNRLSVKWTNDFNRLPDVTTNLYGIWPYLTNVDTALVVDASNIATLVTGKLDLVRFEQTYTNDFNVLPDITTNLTGLWPFMTNVDVALASVSNALADAQPRASFVMSPDTNDIHTGQDVGTAWTALGNTNLGGWYNRNYVTNGIVNTRSASDNYWVIPSNGFYVLQASIAHTQYATGGLDTWVTANGVSGSAASNGSSRTFLSNYRSADGTPNMHRWFKSSGSATFYWSAGTTVRVEAASTVSLATNRVNYISVDINRIGGR